MDFKNLLTLLQWSPSQYNRRPIFETIYLNSKHGKINFKNSFFSLISSKLSKASVPTLCGIYYPVYRIKKFGDKTI